MTGADRMGEQTVSIHNTGAVRLRQAVIRRAAALSAAVVAAAALAILFPAGPLDVRLGAVAVPALAAVALAFLLVRAVFEHLETPKTIEFSAIILLARYRGRHFTGLAWSEISSILPVRTRFLLVGGPLYDLELSVRLKQDVTVKNLSLEAGRGLITAYQQYAMKVSLEEAKKAADGCFDIRRY